MARLKGLFGRGMIERDSRPHLILDSAARIVWTTASAERLLRPPYPVHIRGRRLCFEDGQPARDGGTFLASLDGELRRLMIASSDHDRWVVMSGWADTFADQRLLFLTFALSVPADDCTASGLASQFGLTRAESAVLNEFARMQSPIQIARNLGVTVNTVRSHLKRIHSKMSVNSSTRLLQIVRAFDS